MTSTGEKFGAALAKAVKKTAANFNSAGEEIAAGMKEGMSPKDGTKDLPHQPQKRPDRRGATAQGRLGRHAGTIPSTDCGANHVVGWTVLKPGARHERHLHRNCDEFFIVLKGHGHIYSDLGHIVLGALGRNPQPGGAAAGGAVGDRRVAGGDRAAAEEADRRLLIAGERQRVVDAADRAGDQARVVPPAERRPRADAPCRTCTAGSSSS